MGSVLLAALALPGIWPAEAAAQSAPDKATLQSVLAVNQESQPGLTRVRVVAPSVQFIAPIGRDWSLDTTVGVDGVSGASPRTYTSTTGASKMEDGRVQLAGKATRHFDKSAYTLGASFSKEHDYRSIGGSVEGRWVSDDNSRTWQLGVAFASDAIDSTGGAVTGKTRRTTEIGASVTQLWTSRDLLQLAVKQSLGRGYFSDPYKDPDRRPDQRDQTSLALRWNHAFDVGTLRTHYRYYRDTFGIQAHTLGTEWVQRLDPHWSLTPLLRYHTQSAADFFVDPVTGANGQPALPAQTIAQPPPLITTDQRLSAFGAWTAGLGVGYTTDQRWQWTLRLEQYEQRGSWKLSGQGTRGLAPLKSTSMVLGLQREF